MREKKIKQTMHIIQLAVSESAVEIKIYILCAFFFWPFWEQEQKLYAVILIYAASISTIYVFQGTRLCWSQIHITLSGGLVEGHPL